MAAVAAGAAQVLPSSDPPILRLTPVHQPLMSLLFGSLTQDFVSFGIAEIAYFQDTNNATVRQQLDLAAADFRQKAAADATYLVCIGTSLSLLPSNRLILFQVSARSSAHTSTCSFGSTLAK